MPGRDQRRQLPIGEMGRKDQRRLAVVAQRMKALRGRRIGHDVVFRRARIGVAQALDLGELDRIAAEIVPHPGQDLLDLRRRLVREGGHQIGAADAMLGEPRAELAHEGAPEVGRAPAVGEPDRAQDREREPTRAGVDHRRQPAEEGAAEGVLLHAHGVGGDL